MTRRCLRAPPGADRRREPRRRGAVRVVVVQVRLRRRRGERPRRARHHGDREGHRRRRVRDHGVDLRTAALQFCNAPDVVAAVVAGASSPEQVRENVASIVDAPVPAAFWAAAKDQGLLHADAPIPR